MTLYFSLLLGVVEVGHLHKFGVIEASAVFFKQLNRKNRIEPGVFFWQRKPVCLIFNAFEHAKRANPSRAQLCDTCRLVSTMC